MRCLDGPHVGAGFTSEMFERPRQSRATVEHQTDLLTLVFGAHDAERNGTVAATCSRRGFVHDQAGGARARAGARLRAPRAAVLVPRETSGRKRPDRAARPSAGPKSAPAHPARS